VHDGRGALAHEEVVLGRHWIGKRCWKTCRGMDSVTRSSSVIEHELGWLELEGPYCRLQVFDQEYVPVSSQG
jgi:hypothetical protein